MEAWLLLLFLSRDRALALEMQNRNSCTNVARRLTQHELVRAWCLNSFDGTTLYFHRGRQHSHEHERDLLNPTYPQRK